jgi:hypothetical protein
MVKKLVEFWSRKIYLQQGKTRFSEGKEYGGNSKASNEK